MPGEVIIRQASEDEIPVVLELWREIGVTPPSPSDSLEGLYALPRGPQAVLLLAVIGDQIVGQSLGVGTGGGETYII